ncbi:MAG TPA: hypothetical protein VIX89_06445 [Bryobacteraceae bacterium]
MTLARPLQFAAVILLAVSVPASAFTRKFRLYNTASGEKIELAFKFKWSSMSGQIEGKLPTGERATGEFSGSHDGGVGWGSIYSAGQTATATTVFLGNVRGSLVAIVPGKLTIQCEYVTNPSTTHGNGACSDDHGGAYKLIF